MSMSNEDANSVTLDVVEVTVETDFRPMLKRRFENKEVEEPPLRKILKMTATPITDAAKELRQAISDGDENSVRAILLQSEWNLADIQDEYGETAVHGAARDGFKGIKLLLEVGADSRVQDIHGTTPLLLALQHAREDIAEVLVEYDTRNNLPDHDGFTPLHVAAQQGYEGVIRKLLDNGANPRLQNKFNQTPLHCALVFEKEAVAKILVDIDNENNLQDDFGKTPFYYAVCKGYASIVRRQCFSGVHPHVKNEVDVYPLEEDTFWGRNSIAKMILSACVLKGITIDCESICPSEYRIRYCEKLMAEYYSEIQKMKNRKVCGSTVSYHDLAKRHLSEVAAYLKNEDMQINWDDVKHNFPKYTLLLAFRVRWAKERGNLTAQCLDSFVALSRKLPFLPEISIYSILQYQSEQDMRNFVRAFHLSN